MIRPTLLTALLALLLPAAAPTAAQESEAIALPVEAVEATPEPAVDPAFTAFLTGVRARALAAGVSAATFDRETAGLTPNPKVVRFDRAQPGGGANQAPSPVLDFAPYKAKHVDASRINTGRTRYRQLRPRLERIERATGVPEAVALAIYGHETGYGTYSGNFDLVRSLATLAYDGRRRELFTGELIAALKLIDGGVPRSRLVGSWAGATGYPQFLPSMVLKLAVDGDGDGRKDIWGNEADALASIGNYLLHAGWKPGAPWGVAVRVPEALDRAGLAPRLQSPRCPRVHARHSRWLTLAEWRALGVQPLTWPVPANDELAALIEPDGPGRTGYLLTTNYRAILDYNCSNFYALSVGLLADEVAR